MGTSVSLNGVSYTIPAVGESGWGSQVTSYLVASATGFLQKAGGSFTLTAEVDFGANFGLKAISYKSRATVAGVGVLRLGNSEYIAWRNAANNADLMLTANASDKLIYSGLEVANHKLSNLGVTELNAGLFPDTTAAYNLGSGLTNWNTVHARAFTSAQAVGITAAEDYDVNVNVSGDGYMQVNGPLKVVDATGGYVQVPSVTTANRDANITPTEGMVIYNTTNIRFEGYKSGSWQELGAGGQGGINYIDNGDAEINTSGWATYADAAGTTPVDGDDGSPTVTWTRSTSGPLRGSASFVLAKDAANRQGEGVSYDFSIASADKYKTHHILFEFDSSDANYSAGDIVCYIYDVTNATLITPTATDLPVSTSGNPGKTAIMWQATDSTSYRLILHVAGTTASAWTGIKFDSVEVGPLDFVQGESIAEKIRARYSTDSAQSIPNGTWTRIDFEDQDYDFGNTVTTGASWVFTAPRDGLYSVAASLQLASASGWAETEFFALAIYSGTSTLEQVLTRQEGSNGTLLRTVNGSGDIELSAGDTIHIRAFQDSGATINTEVTDVYNWVAIHEITDHKETRFGTNSDVEVVYNSSTADANDTSSFAKGFGGSQIGALTALRRRRVQFDTDVLATDRIEIQVSQDQIRWVPISDGGYVDSGASFSVLSFHMQNNTSYGFGRYKGVSGNARQLDIDFGQYATSESNGSFGAAGSAWSAGASGLYWRVVKSANPIGIGVPTATSERAGTVSREQYENVDIGADANFTTGTLKCARVGKVVTISWANITHPSGSLVQSAVGLLPAAFRPDDETRKNIYSFEPNFKEIFIASDGQVSFFYKDSSLSSTNDTNTDRGFISYVVD